MANNDRGVPIRLNRTQLSVPAIRPELFEKAAKSKADVVFLDLEDSVSPADKDKARAHAIEGLREVDWGARTVSLRVNAFDTPYTYRDVIEVLEKSGDRLDLLMLPKVNSAADVHAFEILVRQVEVAAGRRKPVGLEVIVETALGMTNVEDIAGASPRLEAIHYGGGDYAASTGARSMGIGQPQPDYGVLDPKGTHDPGTEGETARQFHPGDLWHYASNRILVAARAYGLRAIDGPFGDFSDPQGLEAEAHRTAVMGYDGKWAIHPGQIATINEIFAPTPQEVADARRILDAMTEAGEAGRGAVVLDGRMIDVASIRQAEALVAKAERIAERS